MSGRSLAALIALEEDSECITVGQKNMTLDRMTCTDSDHKFLHPGTVERVGHKKYKGACGVCLKTKIIRVS